jgi:hypothetical protein
VVLEQRWYAHRALRSLLVYEVELFAAGTGGDGNGPTAAAAAAAAACTVVFGNCNGDNSQDMVTTLVSNTSAGVVASRSTTTEPELPNMPITTVARVFRPPPTTLQLAAGKQNEQQFLAVFTTSLSEDTGGGSDPVGAAKAIYADCSGGGANATTLKQTHVAAWAALHSSRIELAGDDETASAVAAAVNSSMFYLLSAARVDWPFSTSPGGLANNA